MSRFDDAIKIVLANEGSEFTNDPSDPGGATKFGISLNFYKTLHPDATLNDIKNLTIEDAKLIYFKEFWEKLPHPYINSDRVLFKLFDLSVNMGLFMAAKCLQRAARANNHDIIDDGIIGTKTLNAVNQSIAPQLLACLKSEAAGYYRTLVSQNKQLKIYLNGWLNRSYADF